MPPPFHSLPAVTSSACVSLAVVVSVAVESTPHMTWQLSEGALQFVIAAVVPALVWPAKAGGCRQWAGLVDRPRS